ncbi:MAG: hypothetical protein A2V65_01610 [Deltaproteobacteria bacterium RBG_13_49_15]|nr:MAG: hypothetical protein A2V65_01610 [Deltaproteobacteria bacterium RBG_13_49_15]
MNIPFQTGSITFTDALMQAKRAAQLRGVPFSTRDVMNLQSGYMEGAAERTSGERSAALGERSADLAEKNLSAQQTNWTNTLNQEKDLAARAREQNVFLTQAQIDAAKTGATKALTGNLVQTGATLGGAYLLMAPPAVSTLPAATVGGVSAGMGGAGEAIPVAASLKASGAASLGLGAAGLAGAAGGYLGGQLAQPIGEAIGVGGEKERGAVGGAVGGAGAAWAAGAMMGAPAGPVGMGVGVAVGGIVGLLTGGGGCIIITACTDRHSPEVKIAREYRDRFMDEEQLAGYYFMAIYIAPFLETHPTARKAVKKWLVDRLVDYGEVVLGRKPSRALRSSWIVSRLFLILCRAMGKVVDIAIRLFVEPKNWNEGREL